MSAAQNSNMEKPTCQPVLTTIHQEFEWFFLDQAKNTGRVTTLQTLCDYDFELPIPSGNKKIFW